LLGFGAEISGGLERVKTVARALVLEGIETEQANAENFGTRHRSAYRLCSAVHEAMGIVISQDRLVRLVKWKDGIVTYWNQVATSILDF
jgi:DNA integrity scanning protein DisA with diadenylate cyclase activity